MILSSVRLWLGKDLSFSVIVSFVCFSDVSSLFFFVSLAFVSSSLAVFSSGSH